MRQPQTERSVWQRSLWTISLSLFALSFVGAMAIGPAIGAWITERFGLDVAFYADAATFLAPAAAVGLLAIPHQRRDLAGHGLGADLWEGFAFARAHPIVLFALTLTTVAFLVIGVMSVTSVVITREILGVETSKVGVLMSAMGVGMLAGAVGSNWLGHHLDRIRLSAAGAGLMAVGVTALPWAPNLSLASVLAVMMGLGMITIQVNCQTILQTVSEKLRGRLMGSATFLAAALAGVLVERVGVAVVLGSTGLMALSAAVIAMTWRRTPAN